MIDRQTRRPRRDSALFLLGLSGILAVELLLTPASTATEGQFIYAFLFGCSIAVMLSGIFRATDQQLITATLSLGVGFGVGAIINFL